MAHGLGAQLKQLGERRGQCNRGQKAAWQAYKKTEEGKAAVMEGAYREDIKQRLRRGDVKGAKERQKQLVNIINIAK